MPQPRIYQSDAERAAAYRARRAQARAAELQAKGLPAAPAIPTMPGRARWIAALNMAQQLVDQVHREMEQYQDERSERWQESDAGSEHEYWMQDVAEALAAVEAAQDRE